MKSNSTYFKKRPFGANIRTLSDIRNFDPYQDSTWDDPKNENGNHSNYCSAKSSNQVPPSTTIFVQHIPFLPNDREAAAILNRIHSEFHKIIERRCWNVMSITEMCCCGDGLDCKETQPLHFRYFCPSQKKQKHKTNQRKRNIKIMPYNVLGYNLTSSNNNGKSPKSIFLIFTDMAQNYG